MMFQNKKILIIGASSGLGRQIAIQLSRQGAILVLVSRNLDMLHQTAAECDNTRVQVFSADVTDEEALSIVISQSIEDGIPFDGFVYSAGMEATLPSKLLKKDFIEKVMSVNTIPPILISKMLLKKGNFNPQGGSFVFISSVMGHLGQTAKTAYSMSKHALSGAAKSLALELAPKKIRVNCVLPGMVKTAMSLKILDSISEENSNKIEKMHPLGLGTPENVADSVEFLLSDKSKWITGIDLLVDGGYSAQ